MENYKVQGMSRKIGAIGIMEPFVENICAESSHEAYFKIRSLLYFKNREHVHITSIYLITDDGMTLVEPRAYLEY